MASLQEIHQKDCADYHERLCLISAQNSNQRNDRNCFKSAHSQTTTSEMKTSNRLLPKQQNHQRKQQNHFTMATNNLRQKCKQSSNDDQFLMRTRMSRSQRQQIKTTLKVLTKLTSIKLECPRRLLNLHKITLCSTMMTLTIVLISCLIKSDQSLSLVSATNQLEDPYEVENFNLHSNSNNKKRQTFQLMRSANIELNRRSLQRQQRDASPSDQQAIVLAAATTTNSGSTGTPICGYPGSPAHASVTFNSSHMAPGTAASYTCDNGYELLGPPRRICQSNGTWSPVGIPFCVLNVGLGKAAMQSSTAGHGSAQKAVDGSTSAYFQANTCTMTDVEHNPWWYVNLLEPYLVQIVRIDFGTACCANRQKATIAVRVGNNRPDLGTNPLCNRYHGFIEEGKPLFLPCTRPAPGAFVSIHLEAPSGSSLSICETFIYTDHALSIEQCPSFRDQPLGSTATYNGKCYLFHNNQALNFDGARKYCESRGGTLVDETSPALQGFLSWELYRRHRNDQLMGQYWLGAIRDARNQQNWKWINGRDVQISFWNSLANQGNCSRFDGSKGWLWSDTDCQAQLNFICQYRPLSCGKPEKPTNSSLITKNIDNGTVIEYQCSPGNLLMGPKSRVCLPTGFFSEFAPKCKYLDCQFPAQIANGNYKLLNGTTSYQSIVTYACQDGYQLYGRSTLTCDVDERWNGPPPRCEPLLCPAPVAPSNGYVTVTANITTPGTQATYDCRPNYELVGERLLSCLASGSWDQSFPYCREKRQVSAAPPSSIQLAGSTVSTSANKPPQVTTSNQQQNRQQQATPKQQAPIGNNGLFSSNRVAPFAVTPSSTTSPSSTTNAPGNVASFNSNSSPLPASLNGLGGQFFVTSAPPSPSTSSGMAISSSVTPPPPQPSPQLAIEQNNRRPAQSSIVSSSVQAPPPQPPPPQMSNELPPPPPDLRTPIMRPQSPVRGPQTVGGMNSPPRQVQPSSPSNKLFTFAPVNPSSSQPNQQQQQGHDDSSSLATTNSVSVHSSSSSAASATPHTHPTTSNPPVPQTTFSSPTSFSTSSGGGGNTNAPNVLASLAGLNQVRNQAQQQQHHHLHHNSLANAKYSLDGIIAVAIFGGFIFLGAIITILVIIIRRRKSGRSSSIDAQTISTFDSNGGEHNGLYRNYQQAWENLRFAAPGSQPKSSGNGPPTVGGSAGGPLNHHGHHHLHSIGNQIGMKSYASPLAATNAASAISSLHHAHPASTGHNLTGLGSSSSASSSSQSSSSLAVTGPAGSGGADPLLGPHHLSSSGHHHGMLVGRSGGAGLHAHPNELLSHHHRQHHAYQAHNLASDDDDLDDELDDDDEQGVISADESNYHAAASAHRLQNLAAARHQRHHNLHQAHLNEGFRDTNELTINADTATLASSSVTAGGARASHRRLYTNNDAPVNGRRPTSSAAHHQQQQQQQDQQKQHSSRLVSTSSSSNSSSNSPQGDDHSLDRLAYGNNWHNHNPNGN